jgi:hypothetical protein
MDYNKKDKLDELIDEGLSGLRGELRTTPDSYLWLKVQRRMSEDFEEESKLQYSRPSIFKIAYTTIAAAAAIMTGIWAGSSFMNNPTQDAELYRQEISMNSGNFSGLSSELINYIDGENTTDDENNR